MKGRLLQNLSVNTLQLLINQAFGLAIFYVLSTGLDKNAFGQLNLALAILLAVFNMLSFGIDQLTVRKLASGEDPQTLLSAYLAHVLLTGILFYGLLLAANLLLPRVFASCQLLIFIGVGKLCIFFSTPFKQFSAGFERFKLQAQMLVVSNTVRGVCLLALALLHRLTLHAVVLIFIAGDMAELASSVLLFKYGLKIPLRIQWNKDYYVKLLREAIPQVGVVVFSSALSRFDWIFIGVFVSAVKLAEYSFAYKVFELATLPLSAIAPLLVPRFTQLFKSGNNRTADLSLLLRLEMVVSACIVLLLNLVWAPMVDGLTGHKYGSVNSITIFILSLSMPLLYFNNFLWSINFAHGKLKMTFWVIGLTCVVNILGDIMLIPFFKNEGAAIAYLVAMVVQAIAYLIKGRVEGLQGAWQPLVVCTFCALVAMFVAGNASDNLYLILPSGITVYIVLLYLSRQLRFADNAKLTAVFSW